MNKKAFTLIELLVVVLIIGILAAIALPQYQKAVVKAQAIQGLTLLKSVSEAAEIYMLANNEWPSSLDDLDIAIPSDFTGTASIYENNIGSRSNGKWSIVIENKNPWKAIHIGMISGDYKGAGFSYYYDTYNNGVIKGKIVYCLEMQSGSSYVFEKTAGDFCQKIFHGVLGDHAGNVRLYEIP